MWEVRSSLCCSLGEEYPECIGEWAPHFFWLGVPWVKLALSQTEMPALFSSSSLFGSYFVGFLIISVNFYIALAIKQANLRARVTFAFAAALIFVSNLVFGAVSVSIMEKKDYKTVTFSALQGNLDSDSKWGSTFDGTLEIYDRLCSDAEKDGAEYVLLPETAFPYNAENGGKVDGALTELARKYGITLFVGTFGERGDSSAAPFLSANIYL